MKEPQNWDLCTWMPKQLLQWYENVIIWNNNYFCNIDSVRFTWIQYQLGLRFWYKNHNLLITNNIHLWPPTQKCTLMASRFQIVFCLQAVCQLFEWLDHPFIWTVSLFERLVYPFVRNISPFVYMAALFF